MRNPHLFSADPESGRMTNGNVKTENVKGEVMK